MDHLTLGDLRRGRGGNYGVFVPVATAPTPDGEVKVLGVVVQPVLVEVLPQLVPGAELAAVRTGLRI